MRVAIIGGGAAGFFAAIHAKENHPEAEVMILEKSKRLLAKVKVSGGGRCNVTNGCQSISQLAKAYPRGGRQLKKAFKRFHTKDTMEWFEARGVELIVQEDNCVFPKSQDSQTIIDCFLSESRRLGIHILTGMGVSAIQQAKGGLETHFQKGQAPMLFDKIIVATGGSPKRKGLEWLEAMGHAIAEPVPSLFTFNMPDEPVRELMGIVAEPASAGIQNTKLKADGPLLITHWGMSGPAILKLSAFGARILADCDYAFRIQVNWVNVPGNEAILSELEGIVARHPKKILANYRPYALPERLWHFLLDRAVLPKDKRWGEIGKKGLHKLMDILSHDVYAVRGKTTFKEEFVTCGGVALESVDFNTMQSRVVPHLYFAGEILDVDGITGGYNFQAAWTTGAIAGELGGAV